MTNSWYSGTGGRYLWAREKYLSEGPIWLSALWWGTHATCSCVEPSLPSDFKHWPWDVQPISGWEELVSQSTEIALFSTWSTGVSEEDCPCGAAAPTSSAFSGDIAKRPAKTQLWSTTLLSHGKKKSREPHVLLDIKMNKATESNSYCGFKLLLHGLRNFGNLSINESKWKSVNKEISLQRTSPAVLPPEAPCFSRIWKHCFCCFCNIKGMQDKQAGEILEFWIGWHRPA